MKTLYDYIFEELENFEILDLNVYFNIICNNNNILIIEALNKFSESDLQIYLDDELLQKFPSKRDLAQKFFGKNVDYIYDAYIEYDKFEHISKEENNENVDLEWNNRYENTTKDEQDLGIFKIYNPRYVIKFEKFELKESDKDDINKSLIDIFKRAESNNLNNYPVQLKFDEKNIEYNDEN